MAGVSDKALLPVGPWPAGIDNLSPETSLRRSEDGKRIIALRELVNADLPSAGWPRRRAGHARVLECARAHSGWSSPRFPFLLFADGGAQYAWDGSSEPFLVREGLSGREISIACPNDRAYCTDGKFTWTVDSFGAAGSWSVEAPGGQPALAAVGGGSLGAGDYQVAVSFVSASGEQGGAGLAAVVRVGDKGAIELSAIPQPRNASVTRIRVHRSPPNGDELFFAQDLPVGTVSATLGEVRLGAKLRTQFLEPMPAGAIVRYLGGRMYVAVGSDEIWSEALYFGLTSFEQNRRRVGGRITMMEAVGEGTDGAGRFVSDEKATYYLGGVDPAQQTLRRVAPPAVPGSSCIVLGEKFPWLNSGQPVAYWMGQNGVPYVGQAGGTVTRANDAAVAPKAARGASAFVEADGIRRMVTTLRDTSPQALAMRDRASARVFRDGIEVAP